MNREHWQTAAELTEAGRPFVVVTMIGLRGHVPQNLGAKAIVDLDGLKAGTVGGGKVEARAIEHARAMLKAGPREPKTAVHTWNLTRDIGMTCGGETTFLFERHDSKSWHIALFGAGHVAQAVAKTLEALDCHVTCIDPRKEWLERIPESAKIKKVLCPNPPEAVEQLSSNCFFVVMTQGHASDLPVLEKIFKLFPDAPYIGVMGSDVKALKMRHELVAHGIAPALVDRLRSPIGLQIGGNSPPEIAISVAAELMQVRDRQQAGDLSPVRASE